MALLQSKEQSLGQIKDIIVHQAQTLEQSMKKATRLMNTPGSQVSSPDDMRRLLSFEKPSQPNYNN